MAPAGVPDQIGIGIDRDGKRAGSDCDVGLRDADSIEQQRRRKDGTPAADKA